MLRIDRRISLSNQNFKSWGFPPMRAIKTMALWAWPHFEGSVAPTEHDKGSVVLPATCRGCNFHWAKPVK